MPESALLGRSGRQNILNVNTSFKASVTHRHTSRVSVYSQYLPSPATWWEERVDCTQQLVVSDDAVTLLWM